VVSTLSQLSDVSISPVPATHSILISNANAATYGAAAFITDIQGHEVCCFPVSAKSNVDVSTWPAGIHFLRLPDGKVMKLARQ